MEIPVNMEGATALILRMWEETIYIENKVNFSISINFPPTVRKLDLSPGFLTVGIWINWNDG